MLIHCFWNQFFEHESTSNDWAAVLRFGFLMIMWQVLRLAPGALLVGGPPCNTWVFMNSGTSRRTRKRVLGDQKKKSVKESNENLGKIVWALFSHLDSIYSMNWSWMINIFFTTKLILPMWSLVALWAWVPRITARWIILGLVATARKVWFLTEQPRSSLMPFYAYVRYMALIIRPLRWGLAYLSGA